MKHKLAIIAALASGLAMLIVPILPAVADQPPAQPYCGDHDYNELIKTNTVTYTHNGKDYSIRLCLLEDDEVGALVYWQTRLMFNDQHNSGEIGLVNQTNGNGHIADLIDIVRIRLVRPDGTFAANCDQTNNHGGSGPGDGGGCDYGNYSQGSGPCYLFQDIQAHPKAYDSLGCGQSGDNYETDKSQSDFHNMENEPTGTWTGTAEFYIEWNDGQVSSLKTPQVQFTV